MSDATYHILELVVLGFPLWGGFLTMIAVFRLYPPHRHVNGKIIYPPGLSPGKIEDMHGDG